MGKYEVWADVAKNRLYSMAEGFLTPEEHRVAIEKVLQELEKLKPGFDFIADLPQMKAVTQESTELYSRVREAFIAKNINRDLVVVKDDITRMQLQRKSKDANYTKQEFVASREEAERMLDNPE